MASNVWDRMSALAGIIESRISECGTKDADHINYDWQNSLYSGPRYRRAHIEIVDKRADYNLYIIHCNIFPHFNDPSPIWGLDAVCGPNKITGAFHDLSLPGYIEHPISKWWEAKTAEYKWNKPRPLPEWAQPIFSKSMVAAGNVQEGEELDAFCELALTTLDYYLANVGGTQQSGADYHQLQNFYCRQQKLNPHVVRSMVAMGEPEEDIKRFVQEVLFLEIY